MALRRLMVARRLPAQSPPDPRDQILAGPVDVVTAHLDRAAGRQRRPGLVGIGRNLETEDLPGPEGDPGVALGGEMQPGGVPGTAGLDRLQRPQVEYGAGGT